MCNEYYQWLNQWNRYCQLMKEIFKVNPEVHVGEIDYNLLTDKMRLLKLNIFISYL